MKNQETIFEASAFIKLEGESVLEFIERNQMSAIYNVVGFLKNRIQIIDYREQGLAAIDKVLQSENTLDFPTDFCFPSKIRITELGETISIELFNLSAEIQPELMLWISTCIQEPIPYYEYPFLRIESMNADTCALASLFNYQKFQPYFDGWIVQKPVQI